MPSRSTRVLADAGARARRGGGGRDPRPADQGGGPRPFRRTALQRPRDDHLVLQSFSTYNRGISFGLFNDGAGLNALVFSLAAAAIIALLLFWLSRAASPLLAVAIGLIIGGAVGNVIDRLRLGAVVDFLDFHVGSLHWPSFNLADSAICIGVAAMLLEGLVLRREAH